MALVTTFTGRTFEIPGTREEATAIFRARQLAADDGFRTIRTTEGEELTLAAGAVALIEETAETRRKEIGFR
jgi:hypothetical protein